MAGIDTIFQNPINHPSGSGSSNTVKLLDFTTEQEVAIVELPATQELLDAIQISTSEYTRIDIVIVMKQGFEYTADTNRGDLTCGIWTSKGYWMNRFIHAIKCLIPTGLSYVTQGTTTVSLKKIGVDIGAFDYYLNATFGIEVCENFQNQSPRLIGTPNSCYTALYSFSNAPGDLTIRFESSNNFGAGTRFVILASK